jgi:hypothetical protein
MTTIVTASSLQYNRAVYEAGPIAFIVLVVLLIWGCNWKGGSKEANRPVNESSIQQNSTPGNPPAREASGQDNPPTPQVSDRASSGTRVPESTGEKAGGGDSGGSGDEGDGGGGGRGRATQDYIDVPDGNGNTIRLPRVENLDAHIHLGRKGPVDGGSREQIGPGQGRGPHIRSEKEAEEYTGFGRPIPPRSPFVKTGEFALGAGEPGPQIRQVKTLDQPGREKVERDFMNRQFLMGNGIYPPSASALGFPALLGLPGENRSADLDTVSGFCWCT